MSQPNQPSQAPLCFCRTSMFRGAVLGGVELLRIELAQHLELLIGRRLRHTGMGGKFQAKTGIVLELLATHSGIERNYLHAPFLGLEPEHGEIGDHAEHAAREQAARSPTVATL